MTEQEWLDCTDPQDMREFLFGKTSDRKLRLLGAAFCRRAWRLLPAGACREAVGVAERYADGLANDRERRARAGFRLERFRSLPLPAHDSAGHDKAQPTAVGCVLTLLTVAVIFGAAVPIVRWRDPETGQPLPRIVAVLAPVLIGAAFHGIGTVLLHLVGLRTWSKSEPDESRPLED